MRKLKHGVVVRVIKTDGAWYYVKAKHWQLPHWIHIDKFQPLLSF